MECTLKVEKILIFLLINNHIKTTQYSKLIHLYHDGNYSKMFIKLQHLGFSAAYAGQYTILGPDCLIKLNWKEKVKYKSIW